ncbi:MAG: hypothetical protein NTW19_10250 [Planctomycetota bacterium]|nr:hypothetical protein [Planctomycetota bacterium]
MSQGTSNQPGATPAATAQALARDLELVFAPRTSSSVPAGSPAPASVEPAALARTAAWLRDSHAPAIVGLSTLSIEGCREAIALAELARARLLPWPCPAGASADHASVTQTASLGHLYKSQLILWVGCHGTTNAVARAIAANQLLASFVPPDRDTVVRFRKLLAADPTAEPIGQHKRVGVVLGPAVDPRVASQWHKLAAQVQEHVRVAVITLPDLNASGNLRGALEAITWQTGQSCARGGVDFADGSPRPCSDAQTLLARGAIDLLIDTSPAGAPLTGRVARRIALGDAANASAVTADETLHLPLPALGASSASRVMRFDGVILWTCADPASAAPDPAAALFRALADALRSRP